MSTVISPPSGYQPQTTFPEVTFRLKDIAPPSNVYIGREEKIFVTSFNSAAGFSVEVHGRILLPNGIVVPIQTIHTPNTDRSSKTTILDPAEGFLLNVFVKASAGSAKRGQCFVIIGLGRGDGAARTDHQVLIQGYVGNSVNLGWPGGNFVQPGEGPGFIRTYIGTQPAAGAEINETVPTGALWRFISIRNNLVTAVAVANRQVHVVFSQDTSGLARISSPVNQAASLGWVYDTHIGVQFYTPIDATEVYMPLPANLIVHAAGTHTTQTTNIQAADQWSAPVITIEEWIVP